MSLLASPELKTFLHKLQRPINEKGEKLKEMEGSMTLDEYYTLFNSTRKSTSSHPPIHYGHFKVAYESETLAQVNLFL